MADRSTKIPGNQIQDGSLRENELDITNTPTDGQIIQINMPTGDFTAIDLPTGGSGGSTFKQTFVTGDLTSDKITITHNLDTEHPQVIVYNGSDNVVLPTETTYLTSNTIELDFTGMTPLTGTYKVRVFGATGATGAFLQTFSNSDLDTGATKFLPVAHNLNQKYVLLEVYDNNDLLIVSDEVTLTDTNNLEVDLTTYAPISGNWNIIVSTGGAGGSGSGDAISDADNDTKIQVEESTDEDIIRFDIAGTEQIILQDGAILPTTDNDVDLGSASKKFKALYLTGASLHLGNTHITESNYNKRDDNIVLNAFRIAVNGSLTQFNMVDGIVDEYEDESGIDNPNSINELYDSINDLYQPSIIDQPFTHYKCNDDTADTVVTDDGSGANNGVANVNTSNYSITGKINKAFEFNGSTEFINIDNVQSDIATDTTGSFSLWLRRPARATGGILIFGDTDADRVFEISTSGTSDDHLYIGFVGGAGSNTWYVRASSVFPINTWINVIIVQDGIEPKIYVDTVLQSLSYLNDVDRTAWFNDYTTGGAILDNGRIGCYNSNSGGNTNFYQGDCDDIRYYQNIALDSTQVGLIYNSGNGSESSVFATDMTLISNSFTAEAQPDSARIVIFEEDVDAITLNTDLQAYASRDGGTTFSQITLVNSGEYEAGRNILSASVDISAQPAGTSMIYKIETLNNKDLKIHGTGLSWD